LAFYLPHLTQENLQHNQIKKKSVLPAYKQYIMLFKNNKQSTRQIKPKMKRTFSASLWAVFALLSEMGLFFPQRKCSTSSSLICLHPKFWFGQSVGEEAVRGLFTSTSYNTIIYNKKLTRRTIIEVK
jgi:hypothetical protein